MNGVSVYKPEKAWQGYTLFCQSYRSFRREGESRHPIYLVDMEGEIAHRWYAELSLQSYCRLLPNGNLIYPTHDRSDVDPGQFGLTEINPDSEAVWHLRCRTDHDFQVLENGNLLVNMITENMWPALGPGEKRQPHLIEITREKDVLWEWHGEAHLAELEALLPPEAWAHVMARATGPFPFDWAHNNTLQVIPSNTTYEQELAAGAQPWFKPGNIFFSYRSLDVIGVIERPSGKIVWAWGPGIIDGQHKPHMLPNGNVLIFDNGTLRGYSRVIELNPLTEAIEWEYTADPKTDFFSPYISGAQRLPNGNTLICEGNRSHLFEVTAKGEIVWDFCNPYNDPDSLGNVYRCLRYAPAYVEPIFARRDQA
jgi:hypothetical protein